MNPFTNLNNLLAMRLLREAERKIGKKRKQMSNKKKEKPNYQLQLNFFDDVKLSKEVEKVEATPVGRDFLQEFVKAEKELEALGFFTPSSKQTRNMVKEKVISFTKVVDGKKVKVSATILPSAKYGLPDTSDLDKYRAFQKILSDELIRNGKVPKHITFTSADLIKVMGKKRRGGEIYKEVKDWLMRMLLTGVQSEGAVWLAGQKVWVDDTIHVFEKVVTCGKKLDDNIVADRHHVWLSDWQLENINSFWLLSM